MHVQDYTDNAFKLFPSLYNVAPEDVKKVFLDPEGLFGRFCIPTSKLGNKIEENNGGGI